MRREFQEARNGLPDPEDVEAVAELFRPQVEWYRERLQAFVSESKEKKSFDLTVAKAAKQYTNMVFIYTYSLANFTNLSL